MAEPPSYAVPLRERQRTALRDDIERAAIRLFAEHGFDQVTTEAIAESVGISPSTFFRHVPNKDQLLLAATQRGRAQIVASVRDSAADEPVSVSVAAAILFRTAQFVDDAEGVEVWRRAMASAPPGLRRASLLSVEDCDELIRVVAGRLGTSIVDGPEGGRAGALDGGRRGVRLRVVADPRPDRASARVDRARASTRSHAASRTAGPVRSGALDPASSGLRAAAGVRGHRRLQPGVQPARGARRPGLGRQPVAAAALAAHLGGRAGAAAPRTSRRPSRPRSCTTGSSSSALLVVISIGLWKLKPWRWLTPLALVYAATRGDEHVLLLHADVPRPGPARRTSAPTSR